MDLLYYFRVVLKRKWIILGVAILAGLVAYYFMRNEPKTYKSVTQISTGFTITDEIRPGIENFSLYDANVKFNNTVATISSPIVINLLSYSLILHDLENPNPFRNLTPEKKKLPAYQDVNQEQARKDFADKIETVTTLSSFNPDEKKLLELLAVYGYDYKTIDKSLSVNRFNETDFIEISFKSDKPELSAFVVNTLFQQFLRYYNTTRGHRSQEGIDTLRTLMERKKQELDAKNAALRGEAPLSAAADSRKLSELTNLERALTDEKARQMNLYSNLRRINQRLAELGVGTTQSTTTATPPDNTNGEVLVLRKAMNDAYMAYINSGSQDKTLLARYNQLKTEYQSKIVNSNASTSRVPDGNGNTQDPALKKADLLQQKNDLDFDIQESTRYVDSLTLRVNSLRSGAVRDAGQEAGIDMQMKDADQANKDYLEAKKRYNDAIDYTSSSLNNFRQVVPGQPAILPEPSKKVLIVALAAIGSAVIATLIIVVLAYLDSSVKTPRLFQRVVNLKLISMINWMNLKQKTINELVTELDPNYDAKDKQRHNVFRESLRKLRYEIEKSGKKTFLFTSTKKGQGKTTIIQALAFSMSMSKKKILIIDTNFCNNDLTVALEAPPILEKIVPNDRTDESLAEQIRNLSKDIGVETVFIIGSEGGDYTPSEILPRKHLLQHLKSLVHDYDYIFLEGPPLNDFSDSRELAQYVDGVIGIFSADQIIKQIDKESLEFFHDLNGKFSGAILNKVDLEMVNVS